MDRVRGRIRHPKPKEFLELIGHLYQKYQDPRGTIRHRGRNRFTDPSHYKPDLPGDPIPALRNEWGFQTIHDVDTTNVWDESNSGAGTSLTVQDERGSFAKVTNGSGDNNYYFYESKYEVGRLQANKGLWFRSHFQIGDVDQADIFIGLCAQLASGDLFDNRVDSIGFYLEDGSAQVKIEASKDSTATQTNTGISITDGASVKIEFHVIGTSIIEFFIDENRAGEIKTNLPDDEEMSFSFGVRNGQASANTMSIGRTTLVQDE
jgi:hypothetical protein